MKNYIKENQKLPLFGIGPYLIVSFVLMTVLGIVVFHYILRIGIIGGIWIYIFRTVGAVFIVSGGLIWFIGALGSNMDNNIANNTLKTDGIYAWVRNPMYSGLWILLFGTILMWHNIWLLVIPVINWLILTIVLINTEEKWLADLYGKEYEDYRKHVNRCVPFKRH
ncbi:MAG: isoprenylcysteine carboxylmethyltransferase family protein [Spirochaetales bacterium]|nr:isoprenylcysteine carboxylmethyltransferase family protein [Spirochaetales bacterium]MBR6201329.1 isoprenylcysteine carboxylmethyltransferase family protein [Spirochaetales bacterium]